MSQVENYTVLGDLSSKFVATVDGNNHRTFIYIFIIKLK